jgi:membrane fusion protein
MCCVPAKPANLTPSLFRNEALAAQASGFGGLLPWRMPWLTALAACIVLLLCVFLAVVSQLQYADKVTVSGKVQPQYKPLVVVSPQAGRVAGVSVRNDQWVTPGAPLLVINKALHNVSGRSINAVTAEFLNAQKQSVLSARAEFLKTAQLEVKLLQDRSSANQQQHESANSQAVLVDKQLRLASKQVQKYVALAAHGWISEVDLDQSQQQKLQVQEALLKARREVAALVAGGKSLATNIALQKQQVAMRQAEFDLDLLKLEQQQAQALIEEQFLVKAPMAGKVVDLLVQAGEQLTAAQPVLTLVPRSNNKLQVVATLPSAAAGRVVLGMSVRLRFSGFPYQRYGSGSGVVQAVSNVAAQDASGFRVVVDVLTLPEQVAAPPAGMSVEADIVLQQQVLWRWLLQPLQAAWRKL